MSKFIFLLVKVQHMGLVDETTWGLQFSLWLSPKPVVTVSCSVLSFPVWPEAWGGGLRDRQLQLCALWFDHHCGDREPAGIMALLLHLWGKFPMPLGTRSLDRVCPSIVLGPLHQVTQSSPSLTLHANAWPLDWWNHQEPHVGWTSPWGPVLWSEGLFHCGFQPACISKRRLSFQVFKRTSEKSAQ